MANGYNPHGRAGNPFSGRPYKGDGELADPFISFGGGGRSLDNAQTEKGVAEGISTTAADGIENSSKSSDILTKNG